MQQGVVADTYLSFAYRGYDTDDALRAVGIKPKATHKMRCRAWSHYAGLAQGPRAAGDGPPFHGGTRAEYAEMGRAPGMSGYAGFLKFSSHGR